MNYMVNVSGLRLTEANALVRYCSGMGFGVPEIVEGGAESVNSVSKEKPRRTRREIIMTVVSPTGEPFTGCAKDVANHIARHTERGLSQQGMMEAFRRGEKVRGYSAIITKDSTRTRKGRAGVVA